MLKATIRAITFLGEKFWGGKEIFGVLVRLCVMLFRYRLLMIVGVFCMVGYTIFTAAPAWFIKDLVDAIESGQVPPLENFVIVGFAIIFIFSVRGLFFYGHTYLIGVMAVRLVADLRMRVYRHLLSLPFSFFTSESSGNLISRVTADLMALRSALSMSITGPLRDVPALGLYIAILFHRSWHLAIASLGILPIAIWLISRFGKKNNAYVAKRQASFGELTALLVEALAGIRVVKAFSMERYEERRYEKANQELLVRQKRIIRVASYSVPILETLGALAAAGIFMLGGYLIIHGMITTGDFASFIFTFFLLNDPIKKLNGFSLKVQEGIASARRVFELLDAKPEGLEKRGVPALPPFKKEISIRVDSFQYEESNEPTLQDIKMVVKVGEAVALVGTSGSGKTTLVNLIPRFFDLRDGAILIDGQDIQNVTLSSLRDQIAIVTQEIFLFHDTIANNIAYGNIDCPRDRIQKAAEAANAHGFIMEMSKGYQTVIGESGMQLSGGQRQRLAIARALIKDAPILILDEATSALDSEAENEVQEAIERLMVSRTTFVIAHRLSTIRRTNRIYVMSKGRIVESGQHNELLELGGQYKKLHDMQFRDVIPFVERPQRTAWQRWWSRMKDASGDAAIKTN